MVDAAGVHNLQRHQRFAATYVNSSECECSGGSARGSPEGNSNGTSVGEDEEDIQDLDEYLGTVTSDDGGNGDEQTATNAQVAP